MAVIAGVHGGQETVQDLEPVKMAVSCRMGAGSQPDSYARAASAHYD